MMDSDKSENNDNHSEIIEFCGADDPEDSVDWFDNSVSQT